MRLVSTTINPKLKLGFLLLLGSLTTIAQENSPFSRYGIGDLFAGQNIVNRGLGGLSAPYADGQSINFYNPASYSSNKVVTFDIGLNVDNRNLKSENPLNKFSSTNFTPSYFAIALPINAKRNLGAAFGLRPISRINYSVQEIKRLPGIDSIGTIYEGNGGLYQIFAGMGKRWGGLSVGFNTGYNFGRKETNTRVVPLNDTVFYYESNSRTTTNYGKVFFSGGVQYRIATGKTSALTLGVSTNLKQSLNAKQDVMRETFSTSSGRSDTARVTAFEALDQKGTIEIPSSFTAGLSFGSPNGLIGFEYETSKWSDFKFYGQPDKLSDYWQFRLGGQFIPNPNSVTNYWSRVTFRGGVNFGTDYIDADGKGLKTSGVSVGASLPIRKWRSFDNQYTNINIAIEVGKRGSKDNNITENYFRFSVGFSLSDIWFIPRRYD